MIHIALPDDALTDWASWRKPLDQFTQASGLAISAYDIQGVRQVGPLISGRVAAMLRKGTLWDDNGAGSALERRLAVAVLSSDQPMCDTLHGMRVCAMPLTQFGQVCWRIVRHAFPLPVKHCPCRWPSSS